MTRRTVTLPISCKMVSKVDKIAKIAIIAEVLIFFIAANIFLAWALLTNWTAPDKSSMLDQALFWFTVAVGVIDFYIVVIGTTWVLVGKFSDPAQRFCIWARGGITQMSEKISDAIPRIECVKDPEDKNKE